jgi:hypothetical protein
MWLVASVLCGCGARTSAPPLSGSHVPPPADSAPVATLRGKGGVYVEGVDGARVDSSNLRIQFFGGNAVGVEPGMRRLRVIRQNGGGGPAGLSVKMQAGSHWEFDFQCEAGHDYEFAAAGLFDSRLKVTDTTRGESLVISNDDLIDR